MNHYDEDYIERTEKCRRINKAKGFADLEGTSNQIMWAETIRREKLDEIDELNYKNPQEYDQAYLTLKNLTASQFWIENKERSVKWFVDFVQGRI